MWMQLKFIKNKNRNEKILTKKVLDLGKMFMYYCSHRINKYKNMLFMSPILFHDGHNNHDSSSFILMIAILHIKNGTSIQNGGNGRNSIL